MTRQISISPIRMDFRRLDKSQIMKYIKKERLSLDNPISQLTLNLIL